MKPIAKFLLWLIGVAIPVFIAACYGLPARFSKSGKVIDSESEQGIDNIQVTCLVNGKEEYVTNSYDNGNFTLWYNTPCDKLSFEDVDGENNGLYQARTMTFCQECESVTVEMIREN
jgi:hypothetical protein